MKDKTTATLLAFLLGGLGAHKFYLGQTGMGIVYLLFCWTFIPSVIAFVEFLSLAFMSRDEFNRRYNFTAMVQGMGQPNQLAQSVVVNVPSATPPAPAPVAAAPVDVPAKLVQLNELRISGVLTEQEFAAEKSKLLGAESRPQPSLPA